MQRHSAKAAGIRENSIIKPYFFRVQFFPGNIIISGLCFRFVPLCRCLFRGGVYYKKRFHKKTRRFFRSLGSESPVCGKQFKNRIFAGVFLIRVRPVFSGKIRNPRRDKKDFSNTGGFVFSFILLFKNVIFYQIMDKPVHKKVSALINNRIFYFWRKQNPMTKKAPLLPQPVRKAICRLCLRISAV